MQSFQGEYSGAALLSFVRGLQHADALVRQILRNHQLEKIDEDRWYDLNTARSIYYTVGNQVGERSLQAVGLQMIDTAVFPPGIDDIRSVLASLDHAYKLNCRGPQIGVITCEFADDSTAIVTFSTPFPVALCRGILQGCCKRFMPNALIEQSASEADTGANVVCTFHISW